MNPQEPNDHVEEVPSRLRKGIYVLPNLFTLAALFGGFYAIVMAMKLLPSVCSPPWCSTAWTGVWRA